MKYRRVAAICLSLAACAPHMESQQAALIRMMANRPVTCVAGDDCDSKWDAALAWVTDHSTTGVRTANDRLIATNLFSSGGAHAERYPEFTVVRYAAGSGEYVFRFTSYCEHGFVCDSGGLEYKASFANAVIGLPPGVRKTGPGTYTVKNSALGNVAP